MQNKIDSSVIDRLCEELFRIYPNCTIQEIADDTNLERRVIYRLMNGSTPNAEHLQKLAFKGVDLNYCFTGKRGDTN